MMGGSQGDVDQSLLHLVKMVFITSCKDGLLNSFNPVQLSAWHANVDMQYCVSHCKVVEYVTKYATKSEPWSMPLRKIHS